MFSNCIDRFDCQKKKQNSNKQRKKTKEKNQSIKSGKNSTNNEPLSKEWIGGRS